MYIFSGDAMKSIHYLSTNSWQDAFVLAGIPVSGSLFIKNYGTSTIFIDVNSSTPTENGYPLLSGQSTAIDNKGETVWVRGNVDNPIWISDQDTGLFRDYTLIDLPTELYTSLGNVPSAKRVRVEPGQHSFWEGKEYRIFKQLNIAANSTYTMKIVTALDVVLHRVEPTIDVGSLLFLTYSGGTPAGTFSETIPILRKNNMSSAPNIPSTTAITAGGSVSGGVLIDAVSLVSQTSSGSKSGLTVGGAEFDDRGVAPGTYYWVFQNRTNDVLTGVFRSFWEER